MKEQVIQIPDNLEVKEIKDGKIILVEKEKKLTYEDVAKKLFELKTVYWIEMLGQINFGNHVSNIYLSNANNATSEKQLEKLLAINKLMNVAKYLNGDWKPDIKHEDEEVAYIEMSDNSFETYTSNLHPYYGFDVYFKSEELARQAIEILGEDTIRLALCVDY